MPDFCQPIRDEIARLEQEGLPFGNYTTTLNICLDVDRDLTGPWFGDNDAVAFYIRQVGSDVFWVGFNTNPDPSQFGRWFTHVFKGTRSLVGDTDTVDGEWADVPYGRNRQHGRLTIVRTEYNTFTKQSETGGFGITTWERSALPTWPS